MKQREKSQNQRVLWHDRESQQPVAHPPLYLLNLINLHSFLSS